MPRKPSPKKGPEPIALPMPHASGRPKGPTKQTPEVVEIIANFIALGCTNEEAAAAADINADTLYEWLKQPGFSEAIKKACALRTARRLHKIETGAEGWTGTAWALERIHRDRFAPPKNTAAHEHSGSINHRVVVMPPRDTEA